MLDEVFALADGLTIVDGPSGNAAMDTVLLGRAEVVLVPAGTSSDDVDAARASMERVRSAGRIGLVVLTRSSVNRSGEGEEARAVLAQDGLRVARTEIRWHAAHEDAAAARLTVGDLPPRNHAFREIRGLATELLTLLGKSATLSDTAHDAERAEIS
ncbi:MAG: hypothetical protein ABIT01_03665 [Thermoanaerobaculia bacterium]